MFNKLSAKFRGIEPKYYIYSFLTNLVFYTAVLIPFYTEWGHISLLQVQFLQAWYMVWTFVLEIPTGVIADMFGRKTSVFLGCFFTFCSFLIYGLYPNFYVFLFAEFIGAIGMALISGAAEALLYDSLKEEGKEENYKSVYGKSFSIGQIATIISTLLGGIIVYKFGLNAGMLATSIPILFACFVVIFTKEPKVITSKSKTENPFKLARKGFILIFNNKLLSSLVLNGIFVYAVVYFLIWLYQPLLQGILFPIIYFGVIRALFSLSGMIFNSNLQKTEKLFGNSKKYFLMSGIITICVFILVAIYPNIFTIILAIIVIGGLGQARFSSLSSYINKEIPSESRATTLSSVSMINRIVLIILNPIVGFLADKSIGYAILAISILAIISMFVFPIKLNKE